MTAPIVEDISAYRSSRNFALSRAPAVSLVLKRVVLDPKARAGQVAGAIKNSSISAAVYDVAFEHHIAQPYNWVIHSALAESPLAATVQLARLANLNEWLIDMAILDNQRPGDADYRALATTIKERADRSPDGNTLRSRAKRILKAMDCEEQS